MLIDIAHISDAQEILDLQKLAYQTEAVLYGNYAIPPLTQSLDQMQADFHRQVVLKAMLDGRIVGSVRGYVEEETCHIGRLIVHPDLQKRGIGARLMRSIEHHFSEVHRYELFTGDRSERNLYLYRKLGYKIYRKERLTDVMILVYLEKAGQASEVNGAKYQS